MGRRRRRRRHHRRKAIARAGVISITLTITAMAHAPKMINRFSSDGAPHTQRPGPVVAGDLRRPLTPWPSPFTALADVVDGEPTALRTIPTIRLPKRDAARVRQTPTDDEVVGPARPFRIDVPTLAEPAPYTMPIGPSRILPTPVTAPPFGPTGLDDPAQNGFLAPILSAAPLTFVFEGTEPLSFGRPISPVLVVPPAGVVSVPEPGTLCAVLLTPVLLGRRRQARAAA